MSAFSRKTRRRGLAALALAVPLTFVMSVGAVAAESQLAPSDRSSAMAGSKGGNNGNGIGNQGNHGKPPPCWTRVSSR